MSIADQVKELVSETIVFGKPYEKNGLTVIPASRFMGGGGGGQTNAPEESAGGGAGFNARPVGAFVIRGDEVTWKAAIDMTRLLLASEIVAIVALLSWRSVAKARLRSNKPRS